MNDRILELAEQAFTPINDMASEGIADRSTFNAQWFQLYNQKFAELIIRECVAQIVAKGTDWVDFAPSQIGVRPEYWAMAQQIKQHFGAEE